MGYFHSLPKPILKKTVSRPVSRSTDDQIQGSKDALIQDLEKKLRNNAPQQRTLQKMSYEERMARRLLGADNAASVFDLEIHSVHSLHRYSHFHLLDVSCNCRIPSQSSSHYVKRACIFIYSQVLMFCH